MKFNVAVSILLLLTFFTLKSTAQNEKGDSTICLSNRSQVSLDWSGDESYLKIDETNKYPIKSFGEILYFNEVLTPDHRVFIVLCVRRMDLFYYYLFGFDKDLKQWVDFAKSPLASMDNGRFEYEYVKVSYRNPFVYRFYASDDKRYKTYIVNNSRSQEIKEEAGWFFFKE